MMVSTQFCPVCGAANKQGQTHCFACGQLLATSTEVREGQDKTLLHERYQLGVMLGSGGFSAVYRARDLQTGRNVAIKQIALYGLNSEEIIEATDAFNREVSLLSELCHPQVPRIYDYFSDRKHWYLVLEYLEGTTLERYLETRAAQGKPIQVDEVIEMGVQICTVLEYLHSRQPPVIFRDLKPGNIIRSPDGILCLIDFGIARHFRPGGVHDTQALGTPGYAAPEQYGHAQTTPQSDIYSLGVLLFVLLSGQDPPGQYFGQALLLLDHETFGTELAALVQRMLSLDPGYRPASVREVATMLKAIKPERLTQDVAHIWRPPTPQIPPSSMAGQQVIQTQLPVQPASATIPTPGHRTSRRGVLIGLGALAATAVTGGSFWWINTNTNTSSPPSLYLYNYRGHSQAVRGVAWSPDGKRIASASADSTVQVWDATNGGHVFTYRGHADVVAAVAWSPNGKRIASASWDNTVQIWNATTGSQILTYDGHTSFVNAAVWSNDGRYIASGSDDSMIQVWDATNGGHIFTYRGHVPGNVAAVAWSPDGKRIASGSDDSTVQVWDATTGGHVFTYQGHAYVVAAVAWSPNGVMIASASWDNTVQIWDMTIGSQVLTYHGHTNKVYAVAWSPDGTRIASTAGDHTVQIWDATTGGHVFTYQGHAASVNAVAWSPDGRRVASGSSDDTVQVWDAP